MVLTPTALAPEAAPEDDPDAGAPARPHGEPAAVARGVDEIEGQRLRLAPIAVEDLLLRPSVKIDYQRLESIVRGKAVVVTAAAARSAPRSATAS